MGFEPTRSQQSVLDTQKQKVVVSASAGSGKTTLMIEKILKIIIEDCADISKFLVCTFTNASSAEMKERLYAKMTECIANEKDEKKRKNLIENYEKIEQAKICTIDKMCLDVVKKYYYKLKIDANIETLSDFEASFLKNRAFKQAMDDFELKSSDGISLICSYFLQDRNDEKLKNLIYKLYENIQTRANGFEFLDNVALSLYSDSADDCVVLNAGVAEIDLAVQKLLNLYSTVFSTLDESEDEKLASVLDRDIKVLQSYFNLNIQNKINFLFENNISATRFPQSESEHMEALKNEKAQFKEKCVKLQKYFVIKDVDVMIGQLKSVKEMLLLLIDFLKMFKLRYDDLKLKQNQFEFIDIQHLALKLFAFDDVLNDFTSGIDYVFVDEFQDVNYLQDSLIANLSRSGKLFLVGDAKQSIYGFRLCTPEILMQKIKDFGKKADGLSENLNENFRSDKFILDFVNQIFNCIMTESESGVDYEKSSQLRGKDEFDNGESFGKKVEINILNFDSEEENGENEGESLEDEEENKINDSTLNNVKVYDVALDERQGKDKISLEANFIALKVASCLGQTIYDAKQGCVREVDFKDIAILFRKRKGLFVKVVEILRAKGFPVNAEFKDDIYQSIEVMFINSVLKLVLNFEDDIALATVLTFPYVGLSDEDLAKIRLAYMDEKYFSKCAKLYAREKAEDEIGQKINKLIQFLKEIKGEVYVCDVYQIIKKIEKQFDLKNVLYAMKNEKIISNYEKFLNEIVGLKNYNLIDYLQYLQTRSDSKAEISVSSGDNCITCETIHASKGLEYPIVILASAGDSNKYESSDLLITNEGIGADFYNSEKKWKLPTLVKNYLEKSVRAGEIEEMKRLLYVALTRPKNQLIVIGACKLSKLVKEFRNFAEPSFMQMILSYLKPFERKILIDTKALENKFASINVIDYEDDSDVGICEKVESAGHFSDVQLDFISSYLNYSYPYLQNNKYALKNSVSSILKSENVGENFAIEPQNLEISEHLIASNEIGTAYHSILEQVDFESFANGDCLAGGNENTAGLKCEKNEKIENCEKSNNEKNYCEIVNVTYVQELIDKMQRLGNENVEVVEADEIVKAIKSICALIGKGDKIRKEQPFIFKARHCDIVESKCEEEVLVQGVIDLLIEKPSGEFVVVDYKNTLIKNKEKLKNKYRKQLFLYAFAVKKAFETKKVKTYLYSIKQNELIEVE